MGCGGGGSRTRNIPENPIPASFQEGLPCQVNASWRPSRATCHRGSPFLRPWWSQTLVPKPGIGQRPSPCPRPPLKDTPQMEVAKRGPSAHLLQVLKSRKGNQRFHQLLETLQAAAGPEAARQMGGENSGCWTPDPRPLLHPCQTRPSLVLCLA